MAVNVPILTKEGSSARVGDGQTANDDVYRILNGISGLAGDVAQSVNGFKRKETAPAEAVNVVAPQSGPGVFFGINYREPLGQLMLVAIAAALWFAFKTLRK
jgi:hypothetical protein